MNTEHKSNTPMNIRDLWRTPPYCFQYYDKTFNFKLDAAASDKNHLCENYWTVEDDSLKQEWASVNWCNPPFSEIPIWVNKAIREQEKGNITVMLLPADTSTQWFSDAFSSCAECHLIIGRLSFINEATGRPVSGNNKGSVVFVFNPFSSFRSQTKTLFRDNMKLIGENL